MDTAKRFGIATGAFLDERDDWGASVAKAVADGWRFLELTAITEARLDALPAFLQAHRSALDPFERVSLHAPVGLSTSTAAVVDRLVILDGGFDVIFHPDVYGDEPSLARLQERVVFENMDVQKSFGRTVADLRSVFETYPTAGLCLDVAHVWTNDPTLRLAHDLLDELGGRLRQLHVSGIEPDGTHRPTTAADVELYEPVLARCTHVPWLLESELAR